MQNKPLESVLEKKCVKYANKNKCLLKKMSSGEWVGFPDRTLFTKSGRIVFFEFKRKGYSPRKIQLKVHRELKRFGQEVHVVDDFEDFVKILDGILDEEIVT